MDIKASWFGFELNHLQSILLLTLALIGLLNIPFGLLVGINELLDAIFSSIPAHLAHPSWYTIYNVIDDFKSSIVTILMYLSFFILCLHTTLKIIKNDHRSIFKRTSSQDQVTNWFGFKLNHSQSILLFMLSMVGIIWILFSFIRGLEVFPYSIFFNDLFPNYDRNFQRALFAWLHLTIFIIFLYTIVTTKIGTKRSWMELERYHPTPLVIMFIVSLMVVIFMVFKLLTLFYYPMNLDDLIATFVVLLFSTSFASFSFLRKVRKPINKQISSSSAEPVINVKKNAKSLKLDLVLFLVLIFVFVIIYFGFFTSHLGYYVYDNNFFLSLILGPDTYIISYFISLLSLLFQLFLASLPFYFIFYFLIHKKLTERDLESLKLDIDKKWMGLNVKIKSHAIILYWISLAQFVFLLVYLYALFPFLSDPFSGVYNFFETLLSVILIGAISAFCCYNLIKLYRVQKLPDRP